MMKKIVAQTFLALLLIGCTPDQSAELPPAQKNTAEPAVDPVEEPVEGQNNDTNSSDSDLGIVANPDVTLVAPSGSVDLSELTSEPATDQEGELIVQPAPGIPDPEVKMVQLASQDLADRLGIDIGDITFVEATSKNWPDSGLGCPSPDAIYLTVITHGFQITLEAQDQTYTYHTDMNQNVVLCVDGRPAE